MKKIAKLLLRGWLLSKRLYKKWSFLLILLLIPLTVLVYGQAAKEESGVLTVALAQESAEDPFSTQILQQMADSSQLILFRQVQTPEQAREQVASGKADAAWIFPADLAEKISDFIGAKTDPQGFVKVILREKNVAALLANEKLSGALFVQCARAYYLEYIRQNVPEMDAFTDQWLLDTYDQAFTDDRLFDFYYVNGRMVEENSGSEHYLLSPLRGLLGTIILLCGLATAMYYIRDEEMGCFGLIPIRRRPLAELGYQWVSLIHTGLCAWICLVGLGLDGGTVREMAILLLYPVCCACFAQLIRVLCGGMGALAAALPLLMVITLAVCPVFYDLGFLRPIQYLLPTTYYVNGAFNDRFLLYMPVYATACLAASSLCRVVFKRV